MPVVSHYPILRPFAITFSCFISLPFVTRITLCPSLMQTIHLWTLKIICYWSCYIVDLVTNLLHATRFFHVDSPSVNLVMEVAALGPLLSGGLLVVSVVLLAGLCVSCRKSSHRTSIQQYFSEDDYIQQCHPGPGEFRLVRPTCPAPPVSSRGSGHSAHLTFDNSPLLDQTRRPSFNPNDTGVIILNKRPSSLPDDDYVNEDDDDDEEVKGEGYIEVLPDPPAEVSICVSQQSLASTQSSGRGNYVNVKEEDEQSDASSQNYINVNAEEHAGFHQAESLDSFGNFDSDNNSVSDYVNTSEFNTSPAQCVP
ncbi:hypothetical protein MATL_G00215480 [Megalops atlanticus]|uniref:Linker for activation of T-cells family member 1 n=1 Tax=Megalops atlanticus TaxID=7932 RepID=A0A9D3PIM2_MEGAT|nr:hypothetical protein MATL_G00215480 [Megalops atlanticus]